MPDRRSFHTASRQLHRISRISALLLLSVAMIACDSTTNDHSSEGNLTITAPERIRNASAVDLGAVTATATVNGVEISLNLNGDGAFTGNVSVPANSVVPVSIQFSEQVNGEQLVLATQSQNVSTGTSDNQVTLRRSAFDFDSHDADGDSVNNITEREENTNPRDAGDAPPMVNVTVQAALPSSVPGNNGDRYRVEATVGNSIRVLQRSGNQFQGSFFTVNRAPVAVSALFIERVTGQQLTVATQSYELASIFEQQLITFADNGYQLSNRDGDSQSDLAEVIAGTSIFDGDSPTQPTEPTGPTEPTEPEPTDVTFSTVFSVPAEIQNPQTLYGEFQINGQTVNLSRDTNTFTAVSNAAAGSSVALNVELKDNFNGFEYTVAQAQSTVTVDSDGQVVQLNDSDFNLQIDTDQDGVLNYIERQQGSNPLVDDSGNSAVTCTVGEVPTQEIPAGSTATLSMTGFVDCGGAAFELSATEFQFSWNSDSNTIQWVVPADAEAGSQLSFTVNVRNPSNVTEVYASLPINTTVTAGMGDCEPASTGNLAVNRDIHVQGTEVFNSTQLRIDSIDRQILLGFPLPPSAMLSGTATLSMTVGDDAGDGAIEVFQFDALQWSEADDAELDIPSGGVAVGSLSSLWQSGQQYQFSLSGLTQPTTGDLTLVLRQTSGNDVAFLSRESGTGAVLSAGFTGTCPN